MPEDDSRQADHSTAAELLENILSKDIALERGGAYVHGAQIERRVFNALRLARADERRRGFDTPFEMRKTAAAPGAPAALAKQPGARPLYYWQTVDGVRVQAYRFGQNGMRLISDDARIEIAPVQDEFFASVDGEQLFRCGQTTRFKSDVAALSAAVARMRKKDRTGF